MKLHLGCGNQFVEGWVNVDYSLGARIGKIPVLRSFARSFDIFKVDWNPGIVLHNLNKPLPWPDESAELVYSSHTLEHLRREDGDALVKECVRVLKPGGVLRIVVPDLRRCVEDYLAGRIEGSQFLDTLLVLSDRNLPAWKRILFGLFDDGHTHKCMYDHESFIRLMAKHGLEASKKEPFKSLIPDIRGIELENRTVDSVIVEGVKPS